MWLPNNRWDVDPDDIVAMYFDTLDLSSTSAFFSLPHLLVAQLVQDYRQNNGKGSRTRWLKRFAYERASDDVRKELQHRKELVDKERAIFYETLRNTAFPATEKGLVLRVTSPEDITALCEIRKLLENTLTERQRLVLQLYYEQGYTLGEIGQRLGGISKERVRQIITRSLYVMRHYIASWAEKQAEKEK